jgi:hypothetical protein
MYPGGQIGTGRAVLGGDSPSTGWDESKAAELGGSAGGTETIARTTMGPTNAYTRARAPIQAPLGVSWFLTLSGARGRRANEVSAVI